MTTISCHSFEELLIHNLKVNGLKAAIYASGLSASRYIEYGNAIKLFSKASLVLEVGCGHSILPTFWEKLGLQPIAIDINLEALKWQKNKAESLDAICSDGRYQPFREKSVDAVSCISVIEHFPEDGDLQLARETGRILKEGGFAIISLPLSSHRTGCFTTDYVSDIPHLIRRVLGSLLPAIFRIFGVDRSALYFERHYSLEEVDRRVVVPSNCRLEDFQGLGSDPLVKIIHGRIFPQGVLTFLEYLLARVFMVDSKYAANMDAIVIKLRKNPDGHARSLFRA